MITKKINLPDNQNYRQKVLDNLDKEFQLRENFDHMSELYDENMKTREHKDFSNSRDLQKTTTIAEANVAWEMFLMLIIGIKGAAFYLASSFINGFGTKANEFLTSLTISIGLKLKDPSTIELMDGEEPVARDIQKCADKCVSKIIKNSKEIEGRTHLTYEELIGYSMDFDQLVKTFGHSYYDNIKESTMRCFADFVELDNGAPNVDAVLVGENDSSCNCTIL